MCKHVHFVVDQLPFRNIEGYKRRRGYSVFRACMRIQMSYQIQIRTILLSEPEFAVPDADAILYHIAELFIVGFLVIRMEIVPVRAIMKSLRTNTRCLTDPAVQTDFGNEFVHGLYQFLESRFLFYRWFV